MIHTDGKRTIANHPHTNGRFSLPSTPARAITLPRMPVGGFCTDSATREYERLNRLVKEATRVG